MTSCSKEKKHASLIFNFENSKVNVTNFKICKTDYGFQISIESSFQIEVSRQKIKNIFVANDNRQIEIKTFNILYSSSENFPHKAPTKPNGSLAFFKNNNDLTIDVLSDNKPELINLIGEDNISNCINH